MNDELQKKLIELLGKAESFTTDTAPLVFHDMIFWAQIAWVLPFGLLLVLAYMFTVEITLLKRGQLDADMLLLFMLLTGLTILVNAVVTMLFLAAAAQATFAPYAFILEALK